MATSKQMERFALMGAGEYAEKTLLRARFAEEVRTAGWEVTEAIGRTGVAAILKNGTIRYNTPSLYLGTTYDSLAFTFEGGHLVKINLVYLALTANIAGYHPKSYTELFAGLEEAYGPPSKSSSETCCAVGAHSLSFTAEESSSSQSYHAESCPWWKTTPSLPA